MAFTRRCPTLSCVSLCALWHWFAFCCLPCCAAHNQVTLVSQAKTCTEVPMLFFCPLLLTCIIYWACGLQVSLHPGAAWGGGGGGLAPAHFSHHFPELCNQLCHFLRHHLPHDQRCVGHADADWQHLPKSQGGVCCSAGQAAWRVAAAVAVSHHRVLLALTGRANCGTHHHCALCHLLGLLPQQQQHSRL